MTEPLRWFEVTVPLVRRPREGASEAQDVNLRIPSTDEESARSAAREIAWAIVENLPKTGDNNRDGWKLANYGVAAEEAK